MKKFLSVFITFVLILISLSACFSHWQGDTAELIISVSGANRSGVPVYNPDETETHKLLNYEVTLTKGKETLYFSFKAGTALEIIVAPGKWNVKVDSYLDKEIYGTGTADVELKLGQNYATIDMHQAFMISFDANEGSGKKRPLIVRAGYEAILPDGNGFSKSGYDFVSWNTKDDGLGDTYFAGDKYTTNNDSTGITLFAKWEEAKANRIFTFWHNEGTNEKGEYFNNWIGSYNIPPSVRGERITKGDVFIFNYSFTSNVAINGDLYINLLDGSNGWDELADKPNMANIPADTVISGTITFTANKTAAFPNADANNLTFWVDDIAVASKQPTLTFTTFSFIKAQPAQGGTLKDKLEWIKNSNPQNNTAYIAMVTVAENLEPQELYYSGNKVIIILKGDTQERTVSLSSNGSIFTINSGVTLILDNYITLKGCSSNNDSLVKVHSGGTLEMNDGSKITENTNTSGNDGGGVSIGWDGGTFNMKGGTISYNKAPTWGGGGVRVTFGTFIMNGGKITHNTAKWAAGIDFYAYIGGEGKLDKKAVESPGICEISGNVNLNSTIPSVTAYTYYDEDHKNEFNKDSYADVESNEFLYYDAIHHPPTFNGKWDD